MVLYKILTFIFGNKKSPKKAAEITEPDFGYKFATKMPCEASFSAGLATTKEVNL